MSVTDAVERDDGTESKELEELRLYRRQMEAMWDMMQVIVESLSGDMRVQVGLDSLEVSCPSCIRVVGILEASAAIMQQTASLG